MQDQLTGQTSGRPSLYTPELGAEICRLLRVKGGNLSAACRVDGMPERHTVVEWAEKNDAFRASYVRARIAGYEDMSDGLLDIADDSTQDGTMPNMIDHEHINRARLRVDTRKWLLSKVLPKIYGDKLDLNHSGEIGTRNEFDDDDRIAKIDAILAAIERRVSGTPDDGSDLV